MPYSHKQDNMARFPWIKRHLHITVQNKRAPEWVPMLGCSGFVVDHIVFVEQLPLLRLRQHFPIFFKTAPLETAVKNKRTLNYQQVVDFVDVFPTERNPIDLQDLISFTEEAAPLCCSTFHNTTHHHTVHVITHCCTLMHTDVQFV